MPNHHLDAEEQELLDSYENEEWRSAVNLDDEIKKHQLYAAATIQKNLLIGFALPPDDLAGLKKRAAEQGVAYQALLAELVRKYVAGELVEKQAA